MFAGTQLYNIKTLSNLQRYRININFHIETQQQWKNVHWECICNAFNVLVHWVTATFCCFFFFESHKCIRQTIHYLCCSGWIYQFLLYLYFVVYLQCDRSTFVGLFDFVETFFSEFYASAFCECACTVLRLYNTSLTSFFIRGLHYHLFWIIFVCFFGLHHTFS